MNQPTPQNPYDPTSDSPAPGATPPGATPPGSPTSGSPAPPSRRWLGLSAFAAVPAVLGVAAVGAVAMDRRSSAPPAAAVVADAIGVSTQNGVSTENQAGSSGDTTDEGHAGRRPGRRGHRGAAGTITAVSDAGFTLAAGDDEAVEVAVDGDTRYLATTEGSLADVAVGDKVGILGEPTADDTIAAFHIVTGEDLRGGEGRPGGPRPDAGDEAAGEDEGHGPGGHGIDGHRHHRAGTVTAVDGTTLTVETVAGDTLTVTTSEPTTVSVTREIALADLAVDDQVRVFGERSDDGTVTARLVHRGLAE